MERKTWLLPTSKVTLGNKDVRKGRGREGRGGKSEKESVWGSRGEGVGA